MQTLNKNGCYNVKEWCMILESDSVVLSHLPVHPVYMELV